MEHTYLLGAVKEKVSAKWIIICATCLCVNERCNLIRVSIGSANCMFIKHFKQMCN